MRRALRTSIWPPVRRAASWTVLLAGVAAAASAATPEERLAALGVELRTPGPPTANFVRAVTAGELVFLAGHISVSDDGSPLTGKLGDGLAVEQGYAAARSAAVGLLSSLKAEIGELSRVRRVVKVLGMVNCTPDFTRQSQVVNGASDLLVEVFGEAVGKHARAAVGMASLPAGAAVEVEMIVEIATE